MPQLRKFILDQQNLKVRVTTTLFSIHKINVTIKITT